MSKYTCGDCPWFIPGGEGMKGDCLGLEGNPRCPNCKKLRDELSAAKESWKSSESAKDVLLEDLEQAEAKLSEVEIDRLTGLKEATEQRDRLIGQWTHCENKLNAAIAKLSECQKERDRYRKALEEASRAHGINCPCGICTALKGEE